MVVKRVWLKWRQPSLPAENTSTIETAVTTFAIDFPAYGQTRASNELRKQGVLVSPSGVRSIWMRHDLTSMKQRLRALEKLSAKQGRVLTEA